MNKPGRATRRHFMGGLIAAFGISRSAPFGFALQGRRRIQGFADGARTDLQAEYDTWLRVSVGTEEDMRLFVAAFKEIFPA